MENKFYSNLFLEFFLASFLTDQYIQEFIFGVRRTLFKMHYALTYQIIFLDAKIKKLEKIKVIIEIIQIKCKTPMFVWDRLTA